MEEFKIDINVTERGRKTPKWTLEGDIDGSITLEELFAFTKNSLINISREALKEEQAKGFPKEHLTIVDRSYTKKIEDVSPLGNIRFLRQQAIDEVLISIYESLLERSPVLTGAYKSSHVVMFNNQRVADSIDTLKVWLKNIPDLKDKDKIRFVDTQPYSGRLERYGVTNEGTKTKFKKSKDKRNTTGFVRRPNGVYTLAARKAKAKYGKNVYIQFEFRPGSSMGIPRPQNAKHEYVYPTILVYIFKSGIL